METSQEIADYLFQNHKIFKVKDLRTPKVSIDGEIYTKSTLKEIFNIKWCIQNKVALTPGELLHISKHVFEKIHKGAELEETEMGETHIPEEVKDFKCIADLEDDDRYVIFDIVAQRCIPLGIKRYFAFWNRKQIDPTLKGIIHGVVTYRPDVAEGTWEGQSPLGDRFTCPYFNTHVMADWRRLEPISAEEVRLHPLISRFFTNFFLNDESKEYTLAWMREAVISNERNQTCLCLVGAKGTGKNLLMEFVRALVGPMNYHAPNKDIFTTKFLGELEDRRFVFVDEAVVRDDESQNFVKTILNSDTTLPKKYANTKKMTKLHFSLALATNRDTDLVVEQSDRRFSVPEITNTPMTDYFTPDELTEIWSMALDPKHEEVFMLGMYLTYFCESKAKNKNAAYKGPKFRQLCKTSLKVWERFVLEYVIQKAKEGDFESDYTDMSDEYSRINGKYTLQATHVNQFMKKNPGGVPLGRLQQNGLEYKILIREDLLSDPTIMEWHAQIFEAEDEHEQSPGDFL